jgi:DNA (cytosine-5)-methyltransferase 1
MSSKKNTFFSLFSGAGGLDIGFKEAGFISLGASDIMDESEKMFLRNYPKEPFIKKDIQQLTDH